MSKLSKDVISQIEKRGLVPRSLAYFLAKRSVFWLLAAISILLAAISAALCLFAVADYLQTGGKQFDEMPFEDFAIGVPFLAIAAFALFAVSAYIGLSKTRRGYRYRSVTAIALAAAASLALGLLLHSFNVGSAVHDYLSARIPAYRNYTYIPYEEWQHPEEGRLGGEALSVDGTNLRLRDFAGREWTVDISSATISFSESPVEEGDVAISGEQTGPNSFKAKTIDPFD
jgi:hypothetical protein